MGVILSTLGFLFMQLSTHDRHTISIVRLAKQMLLVVDVDLGTQQKQPTTWSSSEEN